MSAKMAAKKRQTSQQERQVIQSLSQEKDKAGLGLQEDCIDGRMALDDLHNPAARDDDDDIYTRMYG